MELELPEDCARKYRAVRRIAGGGFGAVYEAVHRDLGRRAAIKVLHTFDEPDAATRFGDEARLTASLAHPRIIRVLDFGAAAQAPWIAFEYAEGRSVRELCDAGPVGVELATAIVTQVAEALDEAHGRGVLHRDIKPDNVLEVSAGSFKVVDFGIAKWAQAAVRTAHGTVLGTPAYIAPEQIRGEPASPASDLYALGVMFFELVAGRLPFAGTSATALLENHLHRTPPRVSTLAAVPAGVDRVISRLLEKDPARRHGSAAALITELARSRGGEAQPVVAPARSRALLVAAALGAAVLAWPARPPPAPVVASPAGLAEAEAAARMKRVEDRFVPLEERNSERRRRFDDLATWQVNFSPPREPTPAWLEHLADAQRRIEVLLREAEADLAELRAIGTEYRAVCEGPTGTPYRIGLFVSLLSLQFRVECQAHRFRHHARTAEIAVRARRRPVDVIRTLTGPNPVEFRGGAETLAELFVRLDAAVARLESRGDPVVEATLMWEVNTTGKEFSGARKEHASFVALGDCEARWLSGPSGDLGRMLRDFWVLRCGRVVNGQRVFPKAGDPVVERLKPWFHKLLNGLEPRNREGVQMIIDTFKLK